MKLNLKMRISGISLVETMVAASVISIAILGGMTYRYYSALDGRRAIIQTTAARAALMLCESWRGEGGDENYEPAGHLSSSNFVITSGLGPQVPNGYTLLGKYVIEYNGIKCYATLSFRDEQENLRLLNVSIAWPSRDRGENEIGDMDKLFGLTTYINY